MDPLLGQIIMFGGNFAPRGWALCDGQLIAISSNAALFSLLGTTYGGDGRTTFALPDLRGRAPVHAGTGPGINPVRLGQKGGHESITLAVNNMPVHSHTATLHAEEATANELNPESHLLAIPVSAGNIYADDTLAAERAMSPKSVTIANAGGGQSFNNRNPYQAVNYIIALQGIFPSRS